MANGIQHVDPRGHGVVFKNETSLAQSKRLFLAGCKELHLGTVGHHITFEQVPLGKLWDMAAARVSNLAELLAATLPAGSSSYELTESLVQIIEANQDKK